MVRATGAVCVILSLLGSCGSSAASEFSWCAAEFPLEVTIPPSQGSVEARIVFIAFQGDDAALPSWATDLEADIPAFIRTMAGGQLVGEDIVPLQDMNLTVVLRPEPASDSAWVAPHSFSYYASGQEQIGDLNSDVLTNIAETFDPESYWAGVDVICIIYYGCYLSQPACTKYYGSTGLTLKEPVPGLAAGTAGTRQHMWINLKEEQKEEQEATLAHEYLHLVGFGHPPGKVAGVQYGRYDLQAGGQDGFAELADGLIPVHPYGLTINTIGAGWADPPTQIDVNTLDLRIPDFFGKPLRSERKMFKIAMSTPPAPSSTIQSFLLVNHQGATPYDAMYLGTGLLIWHILSDNLENERARDLEVASGKFANGQPDPSHGCDSLEATSPPGEYVGSATDFFDGVTATEFSYFTNPNTNLYPSSSYSCAQTELTDVAVENIRRDSESGDVLADIYLTRAQLIGAPNGSESIERGSTVSVAWRVRSVVGYQDVDIAISDDGATYRTIESGLPNTGAYSWHVLQKAGTYKLKLVSRDSLGNTWSDESDAFFTVTDSRVCMP